MFIGKIAEEGENESALEKIVATFVQQSPQLDAVDGFCLMFGDLLRKLPEDVRSVAQMEIWKKLQDLVEEQKNG